MKREYSERELQIELGTELETDSIPSRKEAGDGGGAKKMLLISIRMSVGSVRASRLKSVCVWQLKDIRHTTAIRKLQI